MAKQYKALVGFTYPAGKANYERAKRGDPDKVTEWTRVEAGDVLEEPEPYILRSWLANHVVEEVTE